MQAKSSLLAVRSACATGYCFVLTASRGGKLYLRIVR